MAVMNAPSETVPQCLGSALNAYAIQQAHHKAGHCQPVPYAGFDLHWWVSSILSIRSAAAVMMLMIVSAGSLLSIQIPATNAVQRAACSICVPQA